MYEGLASPPQPRSSWAYLFHGFPQLLGCGTFSRSYPHPFSPHVHTSTIVSISQLKSTPLST
uniref:Uncharacterized protein n=1 Tax=Octopus bimaculoides TaxID=37653 RepID=A0A0L8GNT2_OCTBM